MNTGRSAAIAIAVWLAGQLPAGAAPETGQAAPLTANLLWFEEQEAGTDAYPVRMIVSEDFVRIDDDDDAGDFVLMDRATRNVYSISHGNRSILVFDYKSREHRMPEELQLGEVIESNDTAPAIAGRQAQLLRLDANGTTCYHVAAVPGLMEAAVDGLADYARALGNRQLGNLDTVPAEMQTPCFLARYVYAPDWHLRYGLPIQEWDGAGYRRALVNYRADAPVGPELFELPEDYQRIPFAGS